MAGDDSPAIFVVFHDYPVMHPGFSDGPLVDAQGRFVGLNSSALLRGVSITVRRPL